MKEIQVKLKMLKDTIDDIFSSKLIVNLIKYDDLDSSYPDNELAEDYVLFEKTAAPFEGVLEIYLNLYDEVYEYISSKFNECKEISKGTNLFINTVLNVEILNKVYPSFQLISDPQYQGKVTDMRKYLESLENNN